MFSALFRFLLAKNIYLLILKGILTALRFLNAFENISSDSLDFWPWKRRGVQRMTIYKNGTITKFWTLNMVTLA